MFGVLVVKNQQQQVGFLAAFSGQIDGLETDIQFVPHVSTMALHDVSYLKESKIINDINAQIAELENSDAIKSLQLSLNADTQKFEQQLHAQQLIMQANRKRAKKTTQ
ncbi:hypothetical protein ACOBV9_21300 (plasmid) [Pseudoalteromonas espejiana]